MIKHLQISALILLIFITASSWSMLSEDNTTIQHESVETTYSPPYSISQLGGLYAQTRWNRSNLWPGLMLGAGIATAVLTYMSAENVPNLQTVGMVSFSLFSTMGGGCWYAFNRCFQNLGAEIRSLATPNSPDDNQV